MNIIPKYSKRHNLPPVIAGDSMLGLKARLKDSEDSSLTIKSATMCMYDEYNRLAHEFTTELIDDYLVVYMTSGAVTRKWKPGSYKYYLKMVVSGLERTYLQGNILVVRGGKCHKN